jgi:hypothetical protein
MTRTIVISSLAAILVGGCDGLWLDTYWRSEKYVLVAVDARDQMNLAFDLGNGTAVALVGPTVFSLGADDKHIVVKQHPRRDSSGSSLDRSTIHYFVVARTTSGKISERERGVRGPLTEKEFEALAAALSLPAFSKTFADLE